MGWPTSSLPRAAQWLRIYRMDQKAIETSIRRKEKNVEKIKLRKKTVGLEPHFFNLNMKEWNHLSKRPYGAEFSYRTAARRLSLPLSKCHSSVHTLLLLIPGRHTKNSPQLVKPEVRAPHAHYKALSSCGSTAAAGTGEMGILSLS